MNTSSVILASRRRMSAPVSRETDWQTTGGRIGDDSGSRDVLEVADEEEEGDVLALRFSLRSVSSAWEPRSDDRAALDDEDDVGFLHTIQTVCDGDDGDAPPDALQPDLQCALALGVERARALV
ncbi:hypothetical protein DL771_006577 [Monosporascus sp. 5C6A]|nr:hypothetical protein DL771_006577 [Monosporascus sp. 5C6A]